MLGADLARAQPRESLRNIPSDACVDRQPFESGGFGISIMQAASVVKKDSALSS